ncbi:uncharacterized protein EV420DRAFT_1479306 [Desarmillaria tabescens]|uniref:F-box domain-containing protein n=1 Tax=Armillaria tabescens TaxID=1929756 RepID=A0AA39KG86_ARMTA|nr:uncharacterized protein EV420DRAFT_1479306 [Desarmillaria tabescens]KAK0459311.1 hypothetical protein EV420DRAFT_1479306 [Desarmillaria tabescens]
MPLEGPMQRYTWSSCSGCACPNHHIPTHVSEDGSAPDSIPDFSHLERSNDPPLPGEAETLESMIFDWEESAAAISKEIEEMRALRKELLKGVDHLEKRTSTLCQNRLVFNERIRDRKTLLSPVRRLPADVLLHIFHETIEFPRECVNAPGTWKRFGLERPSDTDSPWSIVSVSRRWREVALSFPELWTFINIALSEELFEEGDYGYLRFISLHLSRSGSRPLSVAIYEDGCSSFDELPPSLLGSLFSFAHRIHHLYLHLVTCTFASLSPLRTSFSQLKTLFIAPVDEEYEDCEELEVFDLARELHTVTTINADLSFSFVLSWRSIIRYECDYDPTEPSGHTTPDFFLQLLEDMENLTSCFWRSGLRTYGDGLDHIEEPIACQKLQSLEIASGHLADPEAIRQVIDHLHLPSLSSLRVACSDKAYESEIPFGSITRLIGRSWCRLTTLAFSQGAVPSDQLLYIFDQTPTLEEVELVDVGPEAITDELENADKHLLPRLRSLYLRGYFTFSMAMYASMVESRWKSTSQFSQVVKLKSVTLRKDVNVRLVEKERAICLAVLTPLRTEGLELNVKLQPVFGPEDEHGGEDDEEDEEDEDDNTDNSRDG